MGLYNRSAMAATFDMQIGKFSNSNPPKRVHKKTQKSDQYWRLESVYVDLEYAN